MLFSLATYIAYSKDAILFSGADLERGANHNSGSLKQGV